MGRPEKNTQLTKRALNALTVTILDYLALDRNMAALQEKMMTNPGDRDLLEMRGMMEYRMKLNVNTTKKLKGLYSTSTIDPKRI